MLRRWEDAGGLWRVLGRDVGGITVGLYRCDGGEETDRFVADDPRLEQFLAGRTSSEDSPRSQHGDRDRDAAGRARQARPRDRLGRPLPYGSEGVEPVSQEQVFRFFEGNVERVRDLLFAAVPAVPLERACGCEAATNGVAPVPPG